VWPAALAMAAVIVAYDVLWFSALAYAVDRAVTLPRRRVRRTMDRVTGGVMVGLGVSIAAEAR
jgi:threonine/homoserine/homoserine lactone efflux protein